MELSHNPSPLDYPYENYYLLPNMAAMNKIRSGSLSIYTSEDENNNLTNNNSEEDLQQIEEILEPQLPAVETLTRYQKQLFILEKIKKNPTEVDLKISCFYTSSKSIPNLCLEDQVNCMNLIESFDDIPSVNNLDKISINKLSDCLIETLYWLLIGFINPKILKMNNLEEQWLFEQINTKNISRPLFICKLDGNQPNNDLNRNCKNKKTEYGFLPVNNREVFSLLFNWKRSAKNRYVNKYY